MDPKTCLPHALALELGSEFNIVVPAKEECAAAATGRGGPADGSDNAASNTTIAVVATDAPLTKAEISKVAQMAHDGLALAIRPAHTPFDGDTVFALSTGHGDDPTRPAGAILVSMVGALAAPTLARAVVNAARAATGLHGIPSLRDLSV